MGYHGSHITYIAIVPQTDSKLFRSPAHCYWQILDEIMETILDSGNFELFQGHYNRVEAPQKHMGT